MCHLSRDVSGHGQTLAPLHHSSRRALWHPAIPWPALGPFSPEVGLALCFQAKKADAVTLDGGLVLEAGLEPYKLRPVAAEVYGTETGESPWDPGLGWPGPWPWALGSQSGRVDRCGLG